MPAARQFERPAHLLEFALASDELRNSAQNFRPTRLSAEHCEQCMSDAQLVEQCLRILQVGGIEAFGEPVVNFREHRARFVAPIGIA
jgi:hypothetical protein